ncbi:hypothetical protein P5673_019861 [Acropora cervicornis]|uniref:Uncharacterized protein n=1 Tax=Acropora cervicornis TaxID=6130 RepID=A0AAD9V1P7_ACRCE|nr:hypothetical protein P5673_019861 [Acropora cervicornis]
MIREIRMALTVMNVVFVLLLSLFTLGVDGGAVPCKTSGAKINSVPGKTAKSDDYDYTTHVAQRELFRCHDRCKTYCKEEGPRGIEEWPNCVAFSSYVEVGGTCYCYGWNSKPTWYNDNEYNSGWCEK